MAFVVARPNGRYEIRESVHTEKGPRARSLANFTLLTAETLSVAQARASRPFDPVAVVAGADRVGAPVDRGARMASVHGGTGSAPRRSAGTPRTSPPARRGTKAAPDPGVVLFDLLTAVDQVSPFREPREPEPLLFPPLARLEKARSGTAREKK